MEYNIKVEKKISLILLGIDVFVIIVGLAIDFLILIPGFFFVESIVPLIRGRFYSRGKVFGRIGCIIQASIYIPLGILLIYIILNKNLSLY